MEVGDYVRTKNGRIIKVENYNEQPNNPLFETLNGKTQMKGTIIKSSPNVIDLIQIGDYVNGYYVEDIRHRYDGEMITILEVATGSNYFQAPMYEDDIKSIVTKEQFSSMEYKI